MGVAEDLFAEAEVRRETMRIAEAMEAYHLAERAGYDADLCGAARWTCNMLAGRWESAWVESDSIASRGAPDPHRFWDGTDWAGKDVLIRCLHGLGDTLQFIRYTRAIRATARSVSIEAQPKLKSLLSSSNLADSVITWGETEPAWQVQMEVNELPRIFRTTVQTVPNQVPYLRTRRDIRRAFDEQALKVGLIWAASDFDRTRNIPLENFQRLWGLPRVKFYSLQAGEGWTSSLPQSLVPLSSAETCIDEIAEHMEELDLILTVDTMNAHLAGALARPTWTMLPFCCDWRWMKEGSDTPWYPTMRLFRQQAAGDWGPVIEDVRNSLLALTR